MKIKFNPTANKEIDKALAPPLTLYKTLGEIFTSSNEAETYLEEKRNVVK